MINDISTFVYISFVKKKDITLAAFIKTLASSISKTTLMSRHGNIVGSLRLLYPYSLALPRRCVLPTIQSRVSGKTIRVL